MLRRGFVSSLLAAPLGLLGLAKANKAEGGFHIDRLWMRADPQVMKRAAANLRRHIQMIEDRTIGKQALEDRRRTLQWIDVRERLPELDQTVAEWELPTSIGGRCPGRQSRRVLAFHGRNTVFEPYEPFVFVARLFCFDSELRWQIDDIFTLGPEVCVINNVTHWAELPEPPHVER